ncbi:hypothetical protein [Falsiroseomonas oryziterrae]|uniref:hypothetical protein n=1 Tax=Falsiroseomonas oryziterrae TaxID=2911368 RepID=UPI001F198D20|nr:hypothetical protein [Roseomonas sp. NPKOSM-4]
MQHHMPPLQQVQAKDRREQRHRGNGALAGDLEAIFAEPRQVHAGAVAAAIEKVEMRIVEPGLLEAEQPQFAFRRQVIDEGDDDVRPARGPLDRRTDLLRQRGHDVRRRATQPQGEQAVDIEFRDGRIA